MELALKAATKLRKTMSDVGPNWYPFLMAPREAVEEYDAAIDQLRERKKDGA